MTWISKPTGAQGLVPAIDIAPFGRRHLIDPQRSVALLKDHSS